MPADPLGRHDRKLGAGGGAIKPGGIRGIPTLIVFRAGEEWKRQTGVVPPHRMAELLEIDLEVDED